MSKRLRASMAAAHCARKNAASIRRLSSKLQTRARIFEAGLKAAQARNCPAWDSTRTVSPASPPPRAMADSKIQGWRLSSERSLPSRNRMVFIGRLSCLGASGRPDQSCAGRLLRARGCAAS
jgi:hypothetical protein